ncbi:hypothetical protein C789_251 [Microcystis aeruginosa FACHB-905 = DIANCHI905]|nr:hypothetical protein C789_251 [Microcystis aeruginosa FACHB-905 = DIANCHI905]
MDSDQGKWGQSTNVYIITRSREKSQEPGRKLPIYPGQYYCSDRPR